MSALAVRFDASIPFLLFTRIVPFCVHTLIGYLGCIVPRFSAWPFHADQPGSRVCMVSVCLKTH